MTKKKKPCVDTFIKSYILTGLNNGRQAAIDAGYSEKTADQQASRLLKTVKVKDAIKKHQEAAMNDFIWSKEKKLQMLEDIAVECSRKDPEKGMVNAASAIAALKEHNAMQGDNEPSKHDHTTNGQSLNPTTITLTAPHGS